MVQYGCNDTEGVGYSSNSGYGEFQSISVQQISILLHSASIEDLSLLEVLMPMMILMMVMLMMLMTTSLRDCVNR